MDTFKIILLISALCGMFMVLGGIVLLYRGALSLANVADQSALTVEFKKELRISTQYPALAFFLIGLLFMALSLWVGRSEPHKIVIRGQTTNVDEPIKVTIHARSWNSGLEHQKNFSETIDATVDTIEVEISAPGYKNTLRTLELDRLKNGLADLGDISLQQNTTPQQLAQPKIIALPTNIDPPILDNTADFGGVK